MTYKDSPKLLKHTIYTVRIANLDIVVHAGVFTPDPRSTYSTSMILNHLPEVKQKTVLDLGTGTGILALAAAQHGARSVLAADIHPAAVENAKENVAKHKLTKKIQCIESDLFSNIKRSQKFDIIFANLPISEKIWHSKKSSLQNLQDCIDQIPYHLTPGGRAYITWASFNRVTPVREHLRAKRINYTEIREKHRSRTWYLFELSGKSV